MKSKDITQPNPQGKASLALLDDLHQHRSYRAKAKPAPEWLADYFTSIFVLSASFQFKPVMNTPYYLYLDNHQWKLSLIEPQAWDNCPYTYFAKCQMHEDRSWSLHPVDNWENDPHLVDKITRMQREFFASLNTETPLLDGLPYYSTHLGYYQRLAAFGLANSLSHSLKLEFGDKQSSTINGRKMLENISHWDQLMLTSTDQT